MNTDKNAYLDSPLPPGSPFHPVDPERVIVVPDRAKYWEEKKLVTAAILRRGDTVLLTRRARGEKLAGSWEFPGGKVHDDETPEACLARELQEELSLTCSIGPKLAESNYRYEHGEFTILAYEAEIQSGSLTLTVHDRADWVDVGKLLDYELAPADIPIAAAVQKSAVSFHLLDAPNPTQRGEAP